MSEQQIRLFRTAEHQCSYLPDRLAITEFVDPEQEISTHLCSALNQQGLRRSGRHFYRPNCRQCSQCQSLRVIVSEFKPKRSQKRCWRANDDLRADVLAADQASHDNYYTLYKRYIDERHSHGDMYPATREQYDSFIGRHLDTTGFVEFHLGNDLLMVTQVDQLADGLSAVYSFFDPGESGRGLGNYAILWLIQAAARLGLPYVYLGYWVADAPSMAYKSRFRPAEVYRDQCWTRL